MTKLLNKLIDEDMIERIPDEKDRRVININLTEKGNIFLENKFLEFESSLKNKFSPLSQDKLNKLNDSLITSIVLIIIFVFILLLSFIPFSTSVTLSVLLSSLYSINNFI